MAPDVQPQEMGFILARPEVFDDVMLRALEHRMDDAAFDGHTRFTRLITQALFEGGQLRSADDARECQVTQLGVVPGRIAPPGHPIELAPGELRIGQEEVPHPGNQIGIRTNALRERIGGGAHRLRKAFALHLLVGQQLPVRQHPREQQPHRQHGGGHHPVSEATHQLHGPLPLIEERPATGQNASSL